jgi:hypothetical protein
MMYWVTILPNMCCYCFSLSKHFVWGLTEYSLCNLTRTCLGSSVVTCTHGRGGLVLSKCNNCSTAHLKVTEVKVNDNTMKDDMQSGLKLIVLFCFDENVETSAYAHSVCIMIVQIKLIHGNSRKCQLRVLTWLCVRHTSSWPCTMQQSRY